MTPFAQILASLRSVRQNYIALTNVPTNKYVYRMQLLPLFLGQNCEIIVINYLSSWVKWDNRLQDKKRICMEAKPNFFIYLRVTTILYLYRLTVARSVMSLHIDRISN